MLERLFCQCWRGPVARNSEYIQDIERAMPFQLCLL